MARTTPTGRTPSTLAQLKPDPRNANRGTARGAEMLSTSLKDLGAGRSILIDRHGDIIAGNKTHRAALAQGLKLRVVETDGSELVAVRRTDLDLRDKRGRARRLAFFDNRTSEVDLDWDLEQLTAAQQDGIDLSELFEERELAELLSGPVATVDGLTDPDDVPAERRTGIRGGDVFHLGTHRLLCGDSTNAAHVERLMGGQRAALFQTDPPYAVGYSGGSHPVTKSNQGKANRNKDWTGDYHEANELGEDFYREFLARAVDIAISKRAAWYCWHAALRQAMVEHAWNAAGAFVHQQIIWFKNRPVLTYSLYRWAHEACLMGWVRPNKPRTSVKAASAYSTVWPVDVKEIESSDHPTSKPVALFVRPIEIHTVPGDICYEPFSGSGSQLMAAERTQRSCYAIELNPRFVQVAIDRWEAFTGQKATKVAAA